MQAQQTMPTTPVPVTPKDAKDLILAGKAPTHLLVSGPLVLAGTAVRTLPAGLSAPVIDLSGCNELRELPANLRTRRLNVSGCTALRMLPSGLHCFELDASNTGLQTLPADIRVENRLNLEECHALETLPKNLRTGALVLRGCINLRALPEGLDAYFLDIAGCTRLESWPVHATVRVGRLDMRGCVRLRTLPPWLETLAQLDVSGCTGLTDLPPTLQITSWLDIADTEISWLPVAARSTQLRWRGVPITARIAFAPETITAEEVLAEENTELRRVLLERMGYERFLQAAYAEVLDRDTDAGGERRLLRVPIPGDEPLVCVAVLCPSTERQYLLRVPPTIRTCRKAVAWIAGFDNPNEYQLIAET